MDSSPLWEATFEASVVLHSSQLQLILIHLTGGQKGRVVDLLLTDHSTNSCAKVLMATPWASRQAICLPHFLSSAFHVTALPHGCSHIILPVRTVAIVETKWASLWGSLQVPHREMNPTKR